MQLNALMHCVAYAGKSGIGPETLEAAEEAVNSMRFVRDNRDAFIALRDIMNAFPGALIERERDDYANGSGLGD
jgi:hypothetical protein